VSSPLPFDPIAEARRQWEEHGWTDAAEGMAAVTSLFRVQQILLARIDEQLRSFELTFARYEILMLLHFSRRGSLPQGVIGSRLQVHPTSVTSAVDRLVRQGLVERRSHPTDGRARLTVITDEGRRRALAATDRLNATVFADPGIEHARLGWLIRTLQSMRSGAGDF
jgi:DNA-binding MarR family transcriptional regulator